MITTSTKHLTSRTTVIILSILLSLFLFRVVAQLVQYGRDLPLLPAFADWHSATLPYGWLLASQLLIIAAVLAVIFNIHQDSYRCYRRRALFLLAAGVVYFLFMLVRFVLSITLLPAHPWFGATLPALFHMVLAGIVIVTGLYEYRHLDSTR